MSSNSTRRLRVLVIASWYPKPTSPHAGIFFQDQAIALARAGHEVAVLHPSLTPAYKLQTYPIEIARKPLLVLSSVAPAVPHTGPLEACSFARTALRLYRAYVREHGRPDVIHAQSACWAGLAAALIERVYGVPFVITEHLSTVMRSDLPWWRITLLRAAFSRAGGRLAVSHALARALALHVRGRPFEVLGNTVDLDYFVPAAAGQSTDFRALVVANLVAIKRVDRALRAFGAAFCGDATASLEIAGDGSERGCIEALIRELGLSAQVRLLGRVTRPDVLAAMQRAHVLLVTSDTETFSVSALETLAVGTPVIATRCGGPEDFITPQVGSLVARDDHSAMAEALRDWRVRQSHDRAGIAQTCRSHARAFGYEAFSAKLEAALRAAIEEREAEKGPGVRHGTRS